MKRKLVLLICMALLALTVQADIKLKKQGIGHPIVGRRAAHDGAGWRIEQLCRHEP